MAALDLDAIEERATAATPGPWTMWDGYGPTSDGLMGVSRFGPGAMGTAVIEAGEPGRPLYGRREDWEFIACARVDVPVLVERVRDLEAALARVDALADEFDEVEHLRGPATALRDAAYVPDPPDAHEGCPDDGTVSEEH